MKKIQQGTWVENRKLDFTDDELTFFFKRTEKLIPKKEEAYTYSLKFTSGPFFAVLDGTRTRDPMRDRHDILTN